MTKILVEGEQPQLRRLLSESLWFDGQQVESVGDAAMLWEHLGNTQPDLVLLDAHTDEFGAMKIFFDIKEKFPDLAVMVCQCRNYGDVARIKGAIADALVKNTAPRPDNILGSRETTNDNKPSAIKTEY